MNDLPLAGRPGLIIAVVFAALSAVVCGMDARGDAAQNAAQNAPATGDPAHGKALYQGCTACHSVDENDIGPRHRGIVGRRAGSIENYAYSPALKAAAFIWDERQLDRWLTNPGSMVPGTKMYFKIDDPQSRADIIAYLKELN